MLAKRSIDDAQKEEKLAKRIIDDAQKEGMLARVSCVKMCA